jgi:hypothetical protein
LCQTRRKIYASLSATKAHRAVPIRTWLRHIRRRGAFRLSGGAEKAGRLDIEPVSTGASTMAILSNFTAQSERGCSKNAMQHSSMSSTNQPSNPEFNGSALAR